MSPACLIHRLSPELLQSIIEYICYDSPSTLSSLAFVNKSFNHSTFAFKNRHQNLVFDDHASRDGSKETQNTIKSLLEDATKKGVLGSIRELTVKSNFPTSRPSKALFSKWSPLVELLGKLPYLKTLTFNGYEQIPVMLLDALQTHHPRARLHIKNWSRINDDEDHNNAAELALAKSPNLRSIQARLWNTNVNYDLRFAALKRIIALSPNLESVDLSEGSSGCVVRGYTREQMEEEGRQAKLFEVIPSSNSIKSLKSRGGHHVDTLDGATDLTKLERLDFDTIYRANFFDKNGVANARLTNLKHLSARISPYYKDGTIALENFVAACSPLESLALTDRGESIPLSIILSAHGQSLRTLALHETEKVDDQRKGLSLDELQEIRDNCPLLEDITIDAVNWSSEHLREVLAVLATFSNLSIIRLYIPLGISHEHARTPWMFLDEDEAKVEAEQHKKNPFNPLDDECWLENTWAILRSEKQKHKTKSLQELHVKVGEWEREMGVGYPAGWIIWEQSNRKYFVAKPSERDDRPYEIAVQVMDSSRVRRSDGTIKTRALPKVVDGVLSN